MSRSEWSELPLPPTQEEIDKQSLRRLKAIIEWGNELNVAEQKFVNQLRVTGYQLTTLDEARDLLKHARRIAYPGRSGGVA